jgi:hypothetical protein
LTVAYSESDLLDGLGFCAHPLILNRWRNIAIALIEAEKGEAKAQTCDMA